MSELHPLRIDHPNRSAIENVDPQFVREKLIWARDQSWKILKEVRSQIAEGMTERDAFQMAMKVCKEHGIEKHWHKPFIRFGPGTVLTFHDPLLETYKLKEGDPLYVDLGPVFRDEVSSLEYEGDVGEPDVFGENPEARDCINACLDIFAGADAQWRQGTVSGVDLYRWIKQETEIRGYALVEKVDGHRLGDFPHQKYSRERLAKLDFPPAALLWVLEVQIRHPRIEIGAFYEDLLGLESH